MRASTCAFRLSSRSSAMRLPSRMRAVMRGAGRGKLGRRTLSPIVHHDRPAMTDPDFETTQIEAAVFRRLREHLMQERPDVQNIDLMILAGFCRNCLADWYREAAEHRGITMTKNEARDAVYGGSFA